VLEIDKGVVGPQALAEFLARNNGSGILEQDFQYLEGLRLQPDAYAMFPEHAFLEIQFERTESCGQSPSPRLLHIGYDLQQYTPDNSWCTA
jgi:hypothetical protein